MKAILLARFSPRPNSEKCESCDTQLESMRLWCAQKGHEIIAEFREDALSGDTADERPTLTAAIESCKKGMILVCRDYQRISRNARFLMYVAADLSARGVTLYSLTEGKYEHDDDELFLSFGVRALMGEYMRRKIRKRTKERMRQHIADGRRMSREPAYGFRPDENGPKNKSGNPKMMLPDPDEQRIICSIIEDKAAGLGPRAIARKLAESGLTCRGRPWNHVTVISILRRHEAAQAAS